MHVGLSISAAILVIAIGEVPHAESAGLGAEDGYVDLFNQEASEALVNDLPADISGMNGYLDPKTGSN